MIFISLIPSFIDQERWIHSMNVAITANRLRRVKRRHVRLPRSRPTSSPPTSSHAAADAATPQSSTNPPPLPQRSRQYITSYFPPRTDTEGSIRFRRRKRRS